MGAQWPANARAWPLPCPAQCPPASRGQRGHWGRGLAGSGGQKKGVLSLLQNTHHLPFAGWEANQRAQVRGTAVGTEAEGRGEAREGGREKGIHSPGSLPWCRVGQGAGPSSFTNNLCDLGKGRIGCPPGKAELEAERFPGSKAVVKRLRHFQHNHLKKWPGDRSPRIQNAGLRGGPGLRGRLAPLKCRFYPGISLRTRCLRCP